MVFLIEVLVLEFQSLQYKDNWKGYVEDRRPASNGDPYKITKIDY